MKTPQKEGVTNKYRETIIPEGNICNLLSSSPIPQNHSASPRYQSKYNSSTKQFYASKKKSHQTMGFMKTEINPKDYLRRKTREQNWTIEREIATHLPKEHRRPPVPKRHEAPPILKEKSAKDFIQLNRVNALRRPAAKPAKKITDDRKGDTFFLEFSGLVPKFCMKKEYGKTPKYLVQRRKDLEYAEKLYKESMKEKELIKLTEEDKKDLLEGIRNNWNALTKRYMSLPLIIDTVSLKNRKLELEKKLDMLEKDKELLEKCKNIDIFILPDWVDFTQF